MDGDGPQLTEIAGGHVRNGVTASAADPDYSDRERFIWSGDDRRGSGWYGRRERSLIGVGHKIHGDGRNSGASKELRKTVFETAREGPATSHALLMLKGPE